MKQTKYDIDAELLKQIDGNGVEKMLRSLEDLAQRHLCIPDISGI